MIKNFLCTVDEISTYVQADDRPEAMAILVASGIVTEEQAERMEIEYVD